MARISALILAFALIFGTIEVMAAEADTRTCALTKAIECTPDEGCTEMTMQDIALPKFVRIDLKSNNIISLDKQIPRTSKISSVEQQEGLTIMHGTELRGWSSALGKESGDLTLTASGDGEGIVVFGTCITP